MVIGAALAVSTGTSVPIDTKTALRAEINFLIVPPVKAPAFAKGFQHLNVPEILDISPIL
jgi:hypothetical protein